MADVYWLTFRIHHDADYEHRYNRLVDLIQSLTTKWWAEPTAFIVFRCDLDIDTLAGRVKAKIDPSKDLALVGMPDYKSARLIGASSDKDIFELMPFVKKV
ncbi:hypothetical protein DLM45_04620 [Hyphomicrobium methylovorum]|uniref:hypothetical protein n=1 Tax=Hyphomicrobium methylovorum TaxID=84 RepID=UPI0015E76C40|nr:hypothetical protein [Hyphomicrobium methylovorum]MBA2125509.1 hypothetical protein [Hyphomicrobium methylovorum]